MAFGGRSQLNMSEETFEFVCTTCAKKNKTVEAVRYCVECSGYCCESCTDAHKWFPTLKNHNLLDASQGNSASSQTSSLPEYPTERCSIHKSKIVDMYCEGHDVVGCNVCFFKDHKSCKDSHIHSIPDAIDTIFKLSDCKQTQSLLKDMLVSVETVSKSKDMILQTLNKTRKIALDKVTTFQKALEAVLRRIAESSRQEVEAAYKELENEILQVKHNAENICEDLQTTVDKLNQSEGNRAQCFVCMKIAQEKMKEADIEKMKQEIQHDTDVPLSFIPDQSVMEYIQALQSIGQVQKRSKQKHDLYNIKGSKDITIKLSHDNKKCVSWGSCLIHDNQLLVTDYSNKKLKRIDIQKMSVVDYCTIDSEPYGVCCISKHEVAVACMSDNKIQFISIYNKMTPTKQIKMTRGCFGIASNDGKLYVTDDVGGSLYVYDMNGTLLKTITQDNARNKLFNRSRHVTFTSNGDNMFVGGGNNNGLVCFDGMGNYLSTITDTDLTFVDDVCVDSRGNKFVLGLNSHTVVQFSENGKKLGVVVKQGDGLQHPFSVCFHQALNRMFVTMLNSDVVKMYELE